MENPGRTYLPSELLKGPSELLRRHAFTRWLTRDQIQEANEFCKTIGMLAIYAETNDNLTRYVMWRTPEGARFAIRSGRSREAFLEYDRSNTASGLRLVSLHISESETYSAVWISEADYGTACAVLESFGITPAKEDRAELRTKN